MSDRSLERAVRPCAQRAARAQRRGPGRASTPVSARKTAASFIDRRGGRADNRDREMTETTPASSGTRRAAQSALDVMLTDAAVEHGQRRPFPPAGRRRQGGSRPGAAIPTGSPAARAAWAAGSPPRRGDARRSRRRKGDRRFGDRAWQENWLLRRLLQSYLRSAETVDGLISDAELDWRTERQARFAADNLLDALAPTNFPWSNPAVIKRDRRPAAAPTSSRGAARLRCATSRAAAAAGDGRHQQVRGRPQPRGVTRRGRPAHRGLRAHPLPADDRARSARSPLLIVPPTINKLLHPRPRAGPQHDRVPRRAGPAGVRASRGATRAPSRATSTSTPTRRRCSRRATRSPRSPSSDAVNVIAACSGGIITAGALGHLPPRAGSARSPA